MVSPVSPGVDVEVGHDHRVQAVWLGRPLQHGFESCHVRGHSHAGEGADSLIRNLQRIPRRSIKDIGNKLKASELAFKISFQKITSFPMKISCNRSLRTKSERQSPCNKIYDVPGSNVALISFNDKCQSWK